MRVDFALSLYSRRQVEEELRMLEVGFARYPQCIPEIAREFIDRHCDGQTKVS